MVQRHKNTRASVGTLKAKLKPFLFVKGDEAGALGGTEFEFNVSRFDDGCQHCFDHDEMYLLEDAKTNKLYSQFVYKGDNVEMVSQLRKEAYKVYNRYAKNGESASEFIKRTGIYIPSYTSDEYLGNVNEQQEATSKNLLDKNDDKKRDKGCDKKGDKGDDQVETVIGDMWKYDNDKLKEFSLSAKVSIMKQLALILELVHKHGGTNVLLTTKVFNINSDGELRLRKTENVQYNDIDVQKGLTHFLDSSQNDIFYFGLSLKAYVFSGYANESTEKDHEISRCWMQLANKCMEVSLGNQLNISDILDEFPDIIPR